MAKVPIKEKDKFYTLPEYPLPVTALEVGMLLGFLSKYDVLEKAQKELPTFFKKLNKLRESFSE